MWRDAFKEMFKNTENFFQKKLSSFYFIKHTDK